MKRKSLLLAFLGLSFWLVASAIAAQSLGDFARQQREKQKEAKKAAKVYTNDDLPARPPQEGATAAAGISPISAQAGAETGAAKPATEAKPPEEAPPPAKREKSEDKIKTRDYWDGAFKAARDQLARAQEEQQLVQDEIQLLQMQEGRELQQDLKAEAAQKIAARKDELETKLAATAKAQKALADLEQEFKESGAPEDWSK
jgi:hypothetical protein